jgi:uncharacterized damage-inducible protein DinB
VINDVLKRVQARMKDLSALRQLFLHMEWADAVIWTAVSGNATALADRELRERLHHIHMVQRAFLDVWTGAPFDPKMMEVPDLPLIAREARRYYPAVTAFLLDLDQSELDRPIVVPWAGRYAARSGREPQVPTLGETALQVAMHSTYHRGQVNTRLRALGLEPPLTDFIAWIWNGKPRAIWPTEYE